MKLKIKKKRLFGLIRVFGLVVLFLALVQIFACYHLATAGKHLSELEIEATDLKAGNKLLKEEISKQGSLSLVIEKAEGLGFVSAEEVLYLTSGVPVALGY